MRTLRTMAELRAALADPRRRGRSVGLVPTMGALHEGHLSLVRRARERCNLVVVSLFVNPTQFAAGEDLDTYPRDEARDAELLSGEGADILFAPDVAEVYPAGFATSVAVDGELTATLEGAVRGSGHFRGVTTVVAKLLNMASPDVAFFGAKDAQQAAVIRRMVRDLHFPVEIEVCPTVREPDGLAMSSRNTYLEGPERRRAVALSRGLEAAERAVRSGERDAAAVAAAAREAMDAHGVEPEYVAVVSPESFKSLDTLDGDALVAIAARVGRARLIDNTTVPAPPASHETTRGAGRAPAITTARATDAPLTGRTTS